jgi:hypothetical protein
VVELKSFAGSSDIGFYDNLEFGGYYWQNPEGYTKMSPLTYAANIKDPLLIVHSENDLRCAIEQAEQLFVALKVRGRTVEFLRFPGRIARTFARRQAGSQSGADWKLTRIGSTGITEEMSKELKRCAWPSNDELMMAYHDTEWGVPVTDDYGSTSSILVLDCFQAGLSWRTVLYTSARTSARHLRNSILRRLRSSRQDDYERLMGDAGIIAQPFQDFGDVFRMPRC